MLGDEEDVPPVVGSPLDYIDPYDGGTFPSTAGAVDPNDFFLDNSDDEDAGIDRNGGNLPIIGSHAGGNNHKTSRANSWELFPTIPEHSTLDPSGSEGDLSLLGLGTSYSSLDEDFLLENELQRGFRLPGGHGRKGFPRVSSMPAIGNTSAEMNDLHIDMVPTEDASFSTSPSTLPVKSYSTNDLSSLAAQAFDVPHSQYLTAPHLRKGKGGRQPAQDPRMDPNIDPKKAKRILANRLSAAKSKMKQKTALEVLRHKVQTLEIRKSELLKELQALKELCEAEEEKRKESFD
jgi:hypothetical protein